MSSYNVKEMISIKERLAPGHRMCAGCGATIGVRAVLQLEIQRSLDLYIQKSLQEWQSS